MISKFRNKLTKLQGGRDQVISDLKAAESTIERLTLDILDSEEAQSRIQIVAALTQSQLKYLVEPPVNQGLAAVFDNPYEFELRFTTDAGRTQARQIFKKHGYEYKDLTFSGGGGPVNISTFGLRISGLCIAGLRKFLMMDQPFTDLKSKGRVLEERGAEMMMETSHELGIQMLIISHMPEQQKSADKIFKLEVKYDPKLKNEVTEVK